MARKKAEPKRPRVLGKHHPSSIWSKVVRRLKPRWGLSAARRVADKLLDEFGAEEVAGMIRRGVI